MVLDHPAAAAVVAIGLFVIGESNNAVTLPAADGEKPVAAAGTTHNATLPAHTLTAQTDMPRKNALAVSRYRFRFKQSPLPNKPHRHAPHAQRLPKNAWR